MASIDCCIIHPQSPFRTLVVEPVQEGIYSTYHGSKEFYAIYQRCVVKRCLPEIADLVQGTVHILTGISLLVPIINAVVFQIFVSVVGSYREALREAVDREDTKAVKFYLELGVSPDNIYDTKALLFRTNKREIIEALINAGADLGRTYSGITFLKHLLDSELEDLAGKHYGRLNSCNMYGEAIRKENWPVAAFLIRMGESSLFGREMVVTTSKTKNPLEMLVIRGDARGLFHLFKQHGMRQMKQWVQELQESFPRMKVDWIWTAILSVYCKDQIKVEDKTIYELFKCGVFRAEASPLGFDKKDFVYWAGIQGREDLTYRLMKENLLSIDSSDLEKLLGNQEGRQRSFDFAIRLGYRGMGNEVRQNRYRCKTENPLEGIIATQNAERLETFVECRSFEEVYQCYLELKVIFPNMYTGWIWNVIYEIPQSHFDQYTPIQCEEAIQGPPPVIYPITDLLAFYDSINFEDPSLPHHVGKEACQETLDSNSKTYTPREIRKGFSNIFHAIRTGKHTYKLLDKERAGYRLQLQWIVYYLHHGKAQGARASYGCFSLFKKKDPLSRDQANVLIDMGKSCLMCPGRYNDIFDIAIRRLSEKEMPVVSFEDQLQRHFADLRSRLLNRVVFKRENGCVHAWENLVYHLHQERALPKKKPERIFSSQYTLPNEPESYGFVLKSVAKEAFDREYTPEEMMGVLSEFARVDRKRSQEENDFNEHMMESMINAYSAQFPAIQDLERRMKNRVAERTLFEDQVLPLEEVEKYFTCIDTDYHIPRTEESVTWTFAKHFADFKRAFLGLKIRPLHEVTYGYALPEVIHPLIMGKVLCNLGHLRQRITFAATV